MSAFVCLFVCLFFILNIYLITSTGFVGYVLTSPCPSYKTQCLCTKPDKSHAQSEVFDAEMDCLTRAGISLLEMEQLFTQNNQFEAAVIRFGGLYGPGRHPGNFLARKKELAGASNPVNMIHLEDCIGIAKAS